MIPRRSEDPGHEPLRVPEPRVAPEPKTAEERTVEDEQERVERRDGAIAILILLGLAASHGIGYISKDGEWAALALMVVGIGLSFARQGFSGLASLVRGIFLLWLAISVATVVLISLDSFSGENVLLLSIVWGILLALWLGDRGLARFLSKREERERRRALLRGG
jgi:hypothetical protein